MIPADLQSSLDSLASDGAAIAVTILLAVVAVFALKFLMRAIVGSSQSAGIDAFQSFVDNLGSGGSPWGNMNRQWFNQRNRDS